MTTESVFDERRHALEERFFKNQDAALVARYQAAKELAEQKDALAQASGIHNEEVLQSLLDVGVSAQTMAALSLVPLIEVAWTDQAIERRERAAILDVAAKAGIQAGSASAELLDSWLEHRPGHELLDSWKVYVSSLVAQMGQHAAEALQEEVLAKARAVAGAAGGILGIGRINEQEQAMLDELAKAFATART